MGRSGNYYLQSKSDAECPYNSYNSYVMFVGLPDNKQALKYFDRSIVSKMQINLAEIYLLLGKI